MFWVCYVYYDMGDRIKDSSFLSIIAKHHKEWVATATGLGGGDYAEDIVQEAYLKIYKYANPDKIITDGKVNKGYVFFVIKSILYTLKKEQKKYIKIPIQDYKFSDDSDTSEQEGFQKICDLIDSYMLELQNKAKAENKESYWYDGKIFEMYRDSDLSIRGVAALTDISFVSIFHTLKHVKQDLRDKFQEDWDDYSNEDYELIK